MHPTAEVLRIARQKGVFRLSEATASGIHPEYIRRLASLGQLDRVGRGLYALPTLQPTEHHTLVEVAKRVPRSVFCLLTALRFHRLGTQNPREVWIAIDRRAGRPRVDFTPVRIVRVSGSVLADGIDHVTVERARIQITSPARTVADCFKFRNKIGIDVAIEALRDYLRKRLPEKDLWQYAEVCRVRKVMYPYLEAL